MSYLYESLKIFYYYHYVRDHVSFPVNLQYIWYISYIMCNRSRLLSPTDDYIYIHSIDKNIIVCATTRFTLQWHMCVVLSKNKTKQGLDIWYFINHDWSISMESIDLYLQLSHTPKNGQSTKIMHYFFSSFQAKTTFKAKRIQFNFSFIQKTFEWTTLKSCNLQILKMIQSHAFKWWYS